MLTFCIDVEVAIHDSKTNDPKRDEDPATMVNEERGILSTEQENNEYNRMWWIYWHRYLAHNLDHSCHVHIPPESETRVSNSRVQSETRVPDDAYFWQRVPRPRTTVSPAGVGYLSLLFDPAATPLHSIHLRLKNCHDRSSSIGFGGGMIHSIHLYLVTAGHCIQQGL